MSRGLAFLILVCLAAQAVAAPPPPAHIGLVKVSRGAAWIERAPDRLPALIGAMVKAADVIATGPDGLVGITFIDDSVIALGYNSVLVIERFVYDPVTQRGGFETQLLVGTMSAKSGRLAREKAGMTVRTSRLSVSVRSTDVLVRAGGPR